jgi:hypothetical protein
VPSCLVFLSYFRFKCQLSNRCRRRREVIMCWVTSGTTACLPSSKPAKLKTQIINDNSNILWLSLVDVLCRSCGSSGTYSTSRLHNDNCTYLRATDAQNLSLFPVVFVVLCICHPVLPSFSFHQRFSRAWLAISSPTRHARFPVTCNENSDRE